MSTEETTAPPVAPADELPSQIGEADSLRWENWELKVERAKRALSDLEFQRAIFQRGVLEKYKIDSAKDKIADDFTIVRG